MSWLLIAGISADRIAQTVGLRIPGKAGGVGGLDGPVLYAATTEEQVLALALALDWTPPASVDANQVARLSTTADPSASSPARTDHPIPQQQDQTTRGPGLFSGLLATQGAVSVDPVDSLRSAVRDDELSDDVLLLDQW
jgi:hypothetical protein